MQVASQQCTATHLPAPILKWAHHVCRPHICFEHCNTNPAYAPLPPTRPLSRWFVRHSRFQGSEFFISGESYAGELPGGQLAHMMPLHPSLTEAR